MPGLLAAIVRFAVILDGDPVLLLGDIRQPFLLVRVQGDGVVGDFAQADDDEVAILAIHRSVVPVGSVFPVTFDAALCGHQGGCLRGLRAGRKGGRGRSFVVGLVDISSDNGTYLELGSEEGSVLAITGLFHRDLMGSSLVRDRVLASYWLAVRAVGSWVALTHLGVGAWVRSFPIHASSHDDSIRILGRVDRELGHGAHNTLLVSRCLRCDFRGDPISLTCSLRYRRRVIVIVRLLRST